MSSLFCVFFPLNIFLGDRCFSLTIEHVKLYIEICGVMSEKNNFRMSKQSLSWKLLFRLCNNVFLIRQIELLSFLLTAYNKQTNSLCILSDKAIYFLSTKTGNTHSGNWTANEEWKFKLPFPSTIIYTSHRNIWLHLHISSLGLRNQPTNTWPCKQSLELYMSLSFKNPRESSLQTIRRVGVGGGIGVGGLRACERFFFQCFEGVNRDPYLRRDVAVHPWCTSTLKQEKEKSRSPWFFFRTIGASPWERHIHIHELRIYGGKLWACSSSSPSFFMRGCVSKKNSL